MNTVTRPPGSFTTAIPAALLPPEPEPLPPAKDKVLFICTHNSARSQMAEALLRHFAGDRFEAASAGLQSGTVHPLAVQVMQEIGLDIIPSDCARKCNRVTRSRRSCGEYHFARGMCGLVMGRGDGRDN